MVVLGLGSNLGDRLGYLRRTIHFLKSLEKRRISFRIQAISPIYESEALLPPQAPASWNSSYLNLALKCETSLSPLELLSEIKAIEVRMGRAQRERWAPREIDIDILAWDNQVVDGETLQIPHLGLMERPFALLPMLDLIPDWVNPRPGIYSEMNLKERAAQWQKSSLNGEMPFGTFRSKKTLTEIMGILNLTPDSFSDGGELCSADEFLNRTESWLSMGVRIFDLGAESTRPNAQTISPEEEISRLGPYIEYLQAQHRESLDPMIISIDTRHPKTARWAINRGVHWINDVSGLSHPEMIEVIANSSVDAVFMHSLSIPANKNILLPHQADPTDEVLRWAERKLTELSRYGISHERLIFDPGLGFGKSPQQNWQILKEVRRFHALGVRILIGHSRKSFFNLISSDPFRERDLETAALSLQLCEAGVDYLRVHQPIINQRAMNTWAMINGVSRCQT